MEDKELQNVSSETTGNIDNNQYIDALNQLKQNSVDRSKYEELKAENKRLLDSIVNGQEIEVVQPKESIQDLRNDLFKPNSGLNNIEYMSKALELRDRLIESGEPDPFIPMGMQYMPTEDDIAKAQKVAAVLQDCLDSAHGDNGVFTAELQRRIIDTKF